LIASYPIFQPKDVDDEAELQVKFLMDILTKVRTIRSEMGIAPKKQIHLFLNIKDIDKKEIVLNNQVHIKNLARAKELNISESVPEGEIYAKGMVNNIEISIPLKGLIDIKVEKSRLIKEIDTIEKELEKVNKKLNNQDFINNAPEEVVTKNHQREETLSSKLLTLKESLKNLYGS